VTPKTRVRSSFIAVGPTTLNLNSGQKVESVIEGASRALENVEEKDEGEGNVDIEKKVIDAPIVKVEKEAPKETPAPIVEPRAGDAKPQPPKEKHEPPKEKHEPPKEKANGTKEKVNGTTRDATTPPSTKETKKTDIPSPFKTPTPKKVETPPSQI
jgi:hypothetical protein